MPNYPNAANLDDDGLGCLLEYKCDNNETRSYLEWSSLLDAQFLNRDKREKYIPWLFITLGWDAVKDYDVEDFGKWGSWKKTDPGA